MSIQSRNAGLFLFAALLGGGWWVYRLMRPGVSLHAATLTSAPSQSYLVMLGVGDKAVTNWVGTVTATGATANAPAVVENGVILTLSAATGTVSIAITTPRGNFSFSPQPALLASGKAPISSAANCPFSWMASVPR